MKKDGIQTRKRKPKGKESATAPGGKKPLSSSYSYLKQQQQQQPQPDELAQPTQPSAQFVYNPETMKMEVVGLPVQQYNFGPSDQVPSIY